jgi:hypothetical protein
VVESDAQGLGGLGRILGHRAGHLLSQQLLVVLTVVGGEVAHGQLAGQPGEQVMLDVAGLVAGVEGLAALAGVV